MKKILLRFSTMMRAFFFAVSFIFTLLPLSAYGGIESGVKNLSVISTDYFDIIYPTESECAAEKIAAVCDNDYIEICALVETEPNMRFPVTVTHSVESLNAYFSSVPYNRIVIYDTLPSQSLDMYEDTVESVFYHELTHAVTLNKKNKFWSVMSGVFSDALTPAYLTLTTFWCEGATVSFESRKSGGRLNDPFSTQIVAQAKIENKFPSWRDVTGARDIYPGGTDAYIFGAEFARYLQNTYGMKMYADFWRAAGSHLSPTFVSGVFKSVYDKKITDVWNDFRDSYKVPSVTSSENSRSGKGARDFFSESEDAPLQTDGFSKKNNKKSVFAYLDSCDSGIVWCDTRCGAVWYAPVLENVSGGKEPSYGKSKKLFTMTNITSLSLSADGTMLAVSRLVEKNNVKSIVVVCELKNPGTEKCSIKKQYKIGKTGLRDACVLRSVDGSTSYIASVGNMTSPVQISLHKACKKSSGNEAEKIITLEDNEIPFSLNDAGSGRLALICKKGLSWSVRIYDSDFKSYDSFSLGEGNSFVYGDGKIVFHNLHAVFRSESRLIFTFSWAQLGASSFMLPRAGTLDVQYSDDKKNAYSAGGVFTLQQNDFCGGITDAVGMRPSLVYAASFYDTTRLMVMDGSLPVKHYDAEIERVNLHAVEENNPIANNNYHDSEKINNNKDGDGIIFSDLNSSLSCTASGFAKPYNPFSYLTSGVFIPLGLVPVYSHDSELSQTGTAAVGASWITSDPWGNALMLVSGGYDVVSESGGAIFQITKSNDIASVSLSGTALFDKKGFLQSAGNCSASYTVYTGNVSSVSLSATGFALYGRSYNGYVTESSDDDGSSGDGDESDGYADKEDKKYTTANGSAGIRFSNVHKYAPGYMQYAGVYLQPFVSAEYNSGWRDLNDSLAEVDHGYSNAGVKAGAYIPGIFPVVIDAVLFPSSSYFLSASAEAVLFSYEIQKGIPAVSIYAERLVVSASYTAYESYGDADSWDIADTASLMGDITTMDYTDLCVLNADIVIAPNTSAFVSSFQVKIGGELRFRPNCEEGKNRTEARVRCILVY